MPHATQTTAEKLARFVFDELKLNEGDTLVYAQPATNVINQASISCAGVAAESLNLVRIDTSDCAGSIVSFDPANNERKASTALKQEPSVTSFKATALTEITQQIKSDSASSKTACFIDATGRYGTSIPPSRFLRDLPKLDDLVQAISPVIDKEMPGYFDLVNWGPFIWCLYAVAVADNGNALVAIPNDLLDDFEAARNQLIKDGLIEKIIYLTDLDSPLCSNDMPVTLFILSSGNDFVTFIDATRTESSRPELETVSSLPKTTLLKNHSCIGRRAISLLYSSRHYARRLGDIVTRVPVGPQPSSRGERADATEASVSAHVLTAANFENGLLSSTGESVQIRERRNMAQYYLQLGDIVIPRVFRSLGAGSVSIVQGFQKQHLVASSNLVVLRISRAGLDAPERLALAHALALYLSSGHGFEQLKLISSRRTGSFRWSDLEQIEVPDALCPGSKAYEKHRDTYMDAYQRKIEAEKSFADARIAHQQALEALEASLGSVIK